MHYWVGELAPLLGAIIGLIIGGKEWASGKKALFPKLVAAGLGCMALGAIHDTSYFLITGNYSNGVYVGFLGTFGCFLFILSASYGQLDRLLDDRHSGDKKYRMLALAAPAILLLMFVPTLTSESITAPIKLLYFLGWLLITVASYYNCKHAILPDCGFVFVKAIRPYNIAALALEFSEALYLTMYRIECPWGVTISSVMVGAGLTALMYFAKKGAIRWTI